MEQKNFYPYFHNTYKCNYIKQGSCFLIKLLSRSYWYTQLALL